MRHHQQKKRVKVKYIILLLTLSVLSLTGFLPSLYYGTGIRWNPFVFYVYETESGEIGKYASMILYESGYMFSISVVLLIAILVTKKSEIKYIIFPFFLITLFDLGDYFLFYKQNSYIKLPLLVLMLIIFNAKWIKQKLWTSQ